MKTIVIALGGNALLKRGEPLEADIQRRNIAIAAKVIAEIAQSNQVVITHGNGPQVGLLALQAEAYSQVNPYPLDVLDAESEGMIGYLLEQQLRNYLPERQIITLLTQIEVDPQDSSFQHPTKFIGPIYSQAEAEKLARERKWAIAPDGNAYRRIVASPEPIRILELETIEFLVKSGAIVICAGGGGIPVIVSPEGEIRGVEAVIDKDKAASLLAEKLEADALLLLTDVDALYSNWGQPNAIAFRNTNPTQLKQYQFASGSMEPKVEAACRFVEKTGKIAGIGRLEDGKLILEQKAGTFISKQSHHKFSK
jgi:carbamate kinase